MCRLSIIVLLLSLIFGGCKIFESGKNKPEHVAYQFLDHLQKLEYADAKKYSTTETDQILDMMESLLALAPDNEDKPMPQNAVIIIQKCEISGDDAICRYTTDGVEDKINLVREDGQWLVNISKEEMQSNNN